jgi:hypothetical protein
MKVIEGSDAAPEGSDAAPEGSEMAPEGSEIAPEESETISGFPFVFLFRVLSLIVTFVHINYTRGTLITSLLLNNIGKCKVFSAKGIMRRNRFYIKIGSPGFVTRTPLTVPFVVF